MPSRAPAADAPRAECQLCHKQVATLPNGRLRYHSCQPADSTSTQEAQSVAQATIPTAAPAPDANSTPEDESQEIEAMAAEIQADEDTQAAEGSQDAPEEITVAEGATVEDAQASKPKRAAKAPKEPKEPAERKVPESIQRARAERAALLDRSTPIIKVTGSGDNIKGVAHMYDPEADRTLCGAVVPANEADRGAQGWHETVKVGEQVKSEPTSCDTCSARMVKLQGDGPVRKRTTRKAGDAGVGTPILKQTKGKAVVHITNSKATDPQRTLCGAVVFGETEGWAPVGKGTEADCPTCIARETKLTKAQTAAPVEAKAG